MNKKLITVAVAAALAAPTAFADVTIYGRMNVSVDYTDTDSDVPAGTTNVDKGNLGLSSNSSRIGFKGDENLGNGLKAVWQVESGFTMGGTSAAGTSTLSNRNTYVGLAGDFGTALMGIHDTPFKMTGRLFDPFDDTIADNAQLLGNGNAGIGGFEQRPSNVIAYITPNFNGFNAVAAYVTGLANTTYTDGDGNVGVGGADNNKATAFSINGTYANGPIVVAAAYETHNVKDAFGTADDPSAFRLGGSFNFGPGTVGAMWQQINDYTGADVSRDDWTLFGTYTFGLETVKLAYTQAGQVDVAGTEVPDSDASLLALALNHKFSKRTTGYVQYTALSNENAAQYALGGAGSGYGDPVTPGVGKDPSAFSVGLIHDF